MKDISTLYAAAKSGSQSDISAYTEAINEIVENEPQSYLPNAEYIISSSIGLQTLKPFIERYGLPIAAYDDVVELVESYLHKAAAYGKPKQPYQEALEYLESYKAKYKTCFDMYEAYMSNAFDNIIEEHISFDESYSE